MAPADFFVASSRIRSIYVVQIDKQYDTCSEGSAIHVQYELSEQCLSERICTRFLCIDSITFGLFRGTIQSNAGRWKRLPQIVVGISQAAAQPKQNTTTSRWWCTKDLPFFIPNLSKIQHHSFPPPFPFRAYVQGSPPGCGWFQIPGVSQVEKGEHRTQVFLLCICAYVRFATLVPHLLLL